MDRREAARFLGVSEEMLSRWVRQGLLPGASADGSSFDRAALALWAGQRGIRPHEDAPAPRAPSADPLVAAVERGGVLAGAGEWKTASDAIRAAVETVPGFAPEARADILEQVLARERMSSTAIGHGLAVPHPRKPPGEIVGSPVVSVVHLPAPLDWAALDGLPVHTVFLLLSPNSAAHVQVLARLAHAARSTGFGTFLRLRPGKEELLARLRAIGEGRA